MALTNDANIKAVITAKDEASHVLKKFGDNTSSIGSKVGAALKGVAIAGVAAGAAATAFGVLSVKAFSESEDAIAQTNAVLKSTGQIAGVTAEQVTKLATSLQKTTKFSDEEVRSAENLLLTFTAIGKDIFPQATSTVLDMATALGEDTKSASIQLGKALQDPVLGITALRRVGVNFNDSQKEVIARLVETGHKAEAQKLILKELNTEFGGSAVAAGKTFSGSLARLKNNLNDVQEVIGKTIVNRLGPFISKAADAVAAIDWQKTINNTIDALSKFGRTIEPAINNIKDFANQIGQYLGPKLEALWNTLSTKLIPALVNLWRNVIQPLLPIIGGALVVAIGLATDALNIFFAAVTPVINFLAEHRWIVLALAGAFGTLKAAMMMQAAFDAIKVGVATLRLVTFPSMVASITATSAAWAAAFPVAGILADIGLVLKAIQTVKGAFRALTDAENAANRAVYSNQAAMESVIKNYKAGKISREQYLRFFNSISGQRAEGGSVLAGHSYLVNENTPNSEIFTPNQTGVVSPRSSGSPSTINITVQAGAFLGSDVEARKFAQIILSHLKTSASAKSMTLSQMLG